MKRSFSIMHAMRIFMFVLLVSIAFPAMADFCDSMPQLVIDELTNEGYQVSNDIADYIEVVLPDGTKIGFCITIYGFMDGYRFDGDGFRYYWQISPVDGTWDIAFRRHDTTTPRPDGSYYPDEIGFDLVNRKNGDYIAYHYNGESITACGWRKAADYQGHVMMDGNRLSYYPDGTTTAEATFLPDDSLQPWLAVSDFDDLPGTPQTAKRLVDITESTVAGLFPGYTMRSYCSYNHGYETEASYSKIEDGCLYIKRVVFKAERDEMDMVDTIPVPLSASLLKRLETEPFDELISTDGFSDVFKVEDALDLNRVPVPGVLVGSDAQEDALIFLTKLDENTSQIHIVTLEEGVYSVASSRPHPNNVYMDTFHTNEGEIEIRLDWDTRIQQIGFQQMADGTWQLEWVMNSGEPNFDYDVTFCGIDYEWPNQGTNGIYIGSLSDGMDNLLTMNLTLLPTSEEDVYALVDTDGWAVVNNPDPKDRLHLRVQPKRSAESLGKFYNGTPVQVHETKGDWCRVTIGLDGRLEGWMMKEYLAFGDQMQHVDCVFPPLSLKEERENTPAYANRQMNRQEAVQLSGMIWVVGVVDDDLFIVLTTRGETGYMPQEWFWEGNG